MAISTTNAPQAPGALRRQRCDSASSDDDDNDSPRAEPMTLRRSSRIKSVRPPRSPLLWASAVQSDNDTRWSSAESSAASECDGDDDADIADDVVKREHDFVCSYPTCRAVFTKKDHLRRHAVRYHEVRASGDEYTCDLCDLRFQTRHERELHTRSSDHHARRFHCNVPECGKSYSKREHLQRHVLSVHTPRTTARQDEEEHKDGESSSSKPFWCELCNIGFAYSHGLVRHQKRSHVNQNKPYECAQCLLAFKKKSDLQAHSYVHTGVMPFECEHCSQQFLKKFQLNRHARTHASHKPAQAQVWFCDQPDCSEMLFSAAEKAQHERDAHHNAGSQQQQQEEGATPHNKRKRPQEEDPDTSVDADANRRQLLECKICTRTFQRKQNLRAHLRTHFEVVDERKLHVCPMPQCANAYTRKSNLMAHYNAIHDAARSQRFVCPYEGCAGKFGYKKVLQTHIESVHVNPTPVKKKKSKQGGWTPMEPKARILGTTGDDDVSNAVIVITDKDDKDQQGGEDSVATSSSMSKEDKVHAAIVHTPTIDHHQTRTFRDQRSDKAVYRESESCNEEHE